MQQEPKAAAPNASQAAAAPISPPQAGDKTKSNQV